MSGASLQHQRGAVTLVGAIFLIVIMIVLLEVAQRMAASDITDTALHNDGIDALFLAETGLERAAWRYANGSACTTAALAESDNAGRGSFQIVSATPVGTLCRVRVEGSVTSTTAANTARRTIEGDLNRASYIGWAVGDSAVDAVLLGWDGSSWTQPGPYTGVPVANLTSVYCVATDDCWAVGIKSGSANINHWDGSSWSNVSAPSVPTRNLYSVYCVATDDCWAVGEKDGSSNNLNHWNGSNWSNVSAPSVPTVDLYSVHCVAYNDCWAVGQNSGSSNNLNHWNGSSWSNVSAPSVPSVAMYSVYCAATNDCWAVGQKNGGSNNLNHWNGSSWSNVSAPAVPGKDLNSIHCVAGNDCWAVGDTSGGENINHWNGSAWSRFGPYGGIANDNLNAVAMVSATEVYALGENGTIAAWDGASWNGQTSPVSSHLNSVSVLGSGAGGGSVALVRWTEVVQ